MKLRETETLSRERFGDHVLVRYRWEEATPEPGQFVMVRAGDPNTSLIPFLPRPFFVHDHDAGVASILFEVRGAGTALLAQASGPLLVSEPLGRGFDLAGIGDGPVALVGDGVWVASLQLLARQLQLRGVPHDVYLEAPATAHEAYAGLLSERYPSATLVRTDGSGGAPRKVLERLGDPTRYRTIFVSGSPEMLYAARGACAGKVATQLALRERMACADGSCYGCAVPLAGGGFARACTEGPVFAGEEVAALAGRAAGEAVAAR